VIPAPFTYVRANSVRHALDLLSSHGEGAKLLAGGHSLLPMMKLRLAVPEVVIDVGGLEQLSYIRDDADHITFGALVRHHAVESSPLVRRELPLLAEAASTIGDPQVRHRGTLGGALSHADPASDLAGVALAMDAVMVIEGLNGAREVPASRFFHGFWETALAPDEMLTSVRIPRPAERGWAFQKFTRRAFDWAIVGVAVCGDRQPRIALVNVGAAPVRALRAEQALAAGASVEEAAERAADGLTPPTDQAATADYRRHLVRVLARRAVTAARSR
jgi:carbon-monoxide dehydrogenase medium subunit